MQELTHYIGGANVKGIEACNTQVLPGKKIVIGNGGAIHLDECGRLDR